jgi:choline dehydrogenase-like flavoprotein
MTDIATRNWDVIVVGTGIGGGTIGRRLAEQGLSVLFLEKGPAGLSGEQQFLRTDLEDPEARHLRGYWPKPFHATVDGRQSRFFGPIGCGVGGTSAFYAATLERPERHDIEDTPEAAHPSGGWPVGYDTLAPYYDEAERIYEVCGERDPLSTDAHPPLRPPPPLSADDREMSASFRRNGIHPYHVHMAIRAVPGCLQCFGHKCPMNCKMDGRTAGVEPALATGNAALLDRCSVVAIREQDGRISSIDADWNGRRLSLRARIYVLAAGGLGSPRLLLASKSPKWPTGLGNRNDLVGRNLMFHLTEMIAIWPAKGSMSSGPSKSLALRDFYFVDGARYGALQAMGVDASYGMITHYLNGLFDRSAISHFRTLREFTRVPAYIAAKIFGNAKLFAGIIEDFPYAHNRVLLDSDDPDRLSFKYAIAAELHERRKKYRSIVRKALKGHRTVFLSPQPDLNLAHSCGTLRFGDDPETSVLDRDCRLHDVRNLYVTDSSFMPSSLGINPSLTIAANALRVGDHILAQARHRRLEAVDG